MYFSIPFCSQGTVVVVASASAKQTYGFYPKYPVADAGYGSYNNYISCEQNGIEKHMKFPMFKKETKDRKYQSKIHFVQLILELMNKVS